MPLRIETRFKRAAEFGGNGDELWVRVYPDDISVDAFEDTLSRDEAQRAREPIGPRSGAPAACEADERGAWRVFLSGQGCGPVVLDHADTIGRSTKQTQPAKPDGVPTVILTIATADAAGRSRTHAP